MCQQVSWLCLPWGWAWQAARGTFLAPWSQHRMGSPFRKVHPAPAVPQDVCPSLGFSLFLCKVESQDQTTPKSPCGPGVLRRSVQWPPSQGHTSIKQGTLPGGGSIVSRSKREKGLQGSERRAFQARRQACGEG